MKHLLFTSNFKKILLGLFLSLIVILFGSVIVNYIIENSGHRLSKLYSKQKINSSVFFIGNSRSVPFNSENLSSNREIFNLSQNSLNSFQIENIIKSIKQKRIKETTIFIELTSIIDQKVQCQYSIFYDLKYYFEKKDISKKCSRKLFFERLVPISKINNELFYRLLYYFIFPEKDQNWTNTYEMPETVCRNPKGSTLMKHFFDDESKIKIINKAAQLTSLYSDNNTKIYFFISPVYQKKNYSLIMERDLYKNKFANLVLLNQSLSDSFFNNCDMFADTLHLSLKGINKINEKKIFDKYY